jgi:restriction system protein
VFQLFKDGHTTVPPKDEKPKAADEEIEPTPPTDLASDSAGKPTLLEVLKSLTSGGFERIAQRLLRESGFERGIVTGKSGDGGIDSHGILQVNPFVLMFKGF